MAALRIPVSSHFASLSARRFASASLLALISVAAPAVEEIVFKAGPVRGNGWAIERLLTRVVIDDNGRPSAVVEAGGIRLPGLFKPIETLSARCKRIEIAQPGIECRDGELHIDSGKGEPVFKPGRFDAVYSEGKFHFKLSALELGDGVVQAEFRGSDDGFSLSAEAKSMPLAAMLRLIVFERAGEAIEAQEGVATLKLSWRDSKDSGDLSASLHLKQLAFSDGPGLNAGENLAAEIEIEASRRREPWRFKIDASVTEGQIYLHPVFIDAGQGALEFEASGTATHGPEPLILDAFRYLHRGVAEVAGSARVGKDQKRFRLDRLTLETNQLSLPQFYAAYIKPWLVETAFSKLKASGSASAQIAWSRQGASRATLVLRDVNLEDEPGRFDVLGLEGDVHWSESGPPRLTQLGFKSARFYRIDLGSADVAGVFLKSDFSLKAPLKLPLLGGALKIDELEATGLGGEQLSWQLSGALEPVSLEALTQSLDWPTFSGSLAGEVPALRYAGGELNVDGKLDVRAFDGSVEIGGLKLQQPFGVVPRMTADVLVKNLSLGALTSTFSFGRIDGRLSGEIDDLVLENWRPAAFDARFATPENDTSRHRISQRAVDNLARLGGASEVISSTLLKFLESFSYDRLGISCRLKNGVCEMGGVEPAERGYYLVKGGGFPPRIDVFGFNKLVDWSTLVERLKTITRANEAVIR